MPLRTMIRGAALALVMLAAPSMVTAQATPALLVADSVVFSGGAARLEARGNVEIFLDGRVLRARAITYDRASDTFQLEGPITLIEGDSTVLVADQAELGPDFRTGILSGARLVLDQHLQIAAAAISREGDGRYTQLYQTVASSCAVCEDGAVPLWQIRAKRVIHDTQERQLYFEEAQFRVAGIPVAYLPRLRLPDPTVERASGFLVPEFIADSQLGTGVKIPYFFALASHHDLTLTPYLTVDGTQTLEGRYRRAFSNGTLELNGAISDDDLTNNDTRGYLFAEGDFALASGYHLDLDLQTTSDDDYLRQYGYSDRDRLQSRLALTRASRTRLTQAEIVGFQSLRAGDSNDFLPTAMVNVGLTQRFAPAILGGQAKLSLGAHGHYRHNSDPALGPVGTASARDVLRASAALEWQRDWVWGSGLVTSIQGAGYAETWDIHQDPAGFASGQATRFTPYLGFEARLPLHRVDASGATHVLEPVVQVVLAPDSRDAAPNEDSAATEFDAGNLFEFSRFAGRDARELGNRINIGVGYTRVAPTGWEVGATLGRTIRRRDLAQFNPGTGLDGRSSDWLLGAHFALDDRWRVDTRSVFDDQFTFAKSETILNWNGPTHAIASGYTWLQADPAAGRPIDTSEWTADARLDLSDRWTARVDWRYDFLTNDASDAGVGLTWHTDCVRVRFDAERRFTSTPTLRPSTTYGITVALSGFGRDDRGKQSGRRRCSF